MHMFDKDRNDRIIQLMKEGSIQDFFNVINEYMLQDPEFDLESDVYGPEMLGFSDTVQSMIHLAITYGRTDIFSALLAQRVDVEAVDGEGATPLFYAVTHKRVYMVKALLDKTLCAGADPNVITQYGYTPLFEAVCLRKNSPGYRRECENQIAITKALLTHGADATYVREYNGDFTNLLNFMVCFREGDEPGPDEIDVPYCDNGAYISLKLDGYIARIFSLLLEFGADPNSVSHILPSLNLLSYPLEWVLLNGLTETARVLLKHGAELKINLNHYPMLEAHAKRCPFYEELRTTVLFLKDHLKESAVSLVLLNRINKRLEQFHNAQSRHKRSKKYDTGINYLITPYLTLREHGFWAATAKRNSSSDCQQRKLPDEGLSAVP